MSFGITNPLTTKLRFFPITFIQKRHVITSNSIRGNTQIPNHLKVSNNILQLSKKSYSKPSIHDILNSEDLLDPLTLGGTNKENRDNGTIIPMPKALSPSAAAEFKNCPQSYLFQYLFNIKQPTNLALAKGSMCHSALEEVFNLEPKDRSLPHLQNLYRKVWSQERLGDDYKHLFDIPSLDGEGDTKRDLNAERKWGNEALHLLKNYYKLEDPRLVPRPNPIEREIWVRAHLSLDPSNGVTGNASSLSKKTYENIEDAGDTFLVRGIVDRLDYVAVPPSPRMAFSHINNHENTKNENDKGAIRIIDYKTGKAPNFKYSPAMNEKIANESTWQLKIYALLLREMIAHGKAYSKSGNLQNISGEDLRLLRLMYLTSEDGSARYLDLDLGETQEERDRDLQEVHADLSEIWTNITKLVETQDPKAFVHCDRKWCFCHKLRPHFLPGTLYDRNESQDENIHNEG